MQPSDAWRPTATPAARVARAELYRDIRDFFAARHVLEIETPILARHGITDVHIQCFPVTVEPNFNPHYYLQTSPEYAMKRLLAADPTPIYQISKVFRQGESGSRHNPEFSLLEWYRPGFSQHQLLDEIQELLHHLMQWPQAQRLSYAALFEKFLKLNPHTASPHELENCATHHQIQISSQTPLDRDDWLNVLLTHLIEPQLCGTQPWFICDYPPSQAALAQIRHDTIPVAERFEIYFQGLELGNGFHELADAAQQKTRFELDQLQRREKELPEMSIDQRLIDALAHGLPDCTGVALGLDRLLMLKIGAKSIEEVINFPWGIC